MPAAMGAPNRWGFAPSKAPSEPPEPPSKPSAAAKGLFEDDDGDDNDLFGDVQAKRPGAVKGLFDD